MFKTEDYMKEVELGYLARRVHPENSNVVILNYTDSVVYDRHWNDITLACRGLIINELTGEILARPFGKFFNYSENAEYEKDIPFDEAPEFTVKQDGSLGISYRLNGKIYWATRGSFVSEQADVANKIWQKKYADVEIPEDITLLTEIISPETRIVVNYNKMSDLVIIGAINRKTGYDYNYKELLALGEQLGMQVTKLEKLTLEEALKLKKTIDHNNEGWVLRWSNGKRLKVKGDNYMDVHRIIYGLSDKKKVEFWKENRIEDLIQQVPEEFREEIEEFKAKFDTIFDTLASDIEKYVQQTLKSGETRKEQAIFVNQNVPNEYKGFVFKQIDRNQTPGLAIREYIHKHYLQYLEGSGEDKSESTE